MFNVRNLKLSLFALGMFSSSAYSNCDHLARTLSNYMDRNNQVLSILRIAERLNNASPEYIKSSMEFSDLQSQAEILKKFLNKKTDIVSNPVSSFFNVEKKCSSFDTLFNSYFMDMVIETEFDQFLLSTDDLPVKNTFYYQDAFKGGDIKTTPYFKFGNYRDVFRYIEKSAENITSNEKVFRDAIAERFDVKKKEIEIQKEEIQQLKERIKKEELINKELEELAKQKILLEKKLRQTKRGKYSDEKDNSSNKATPSSKNISENISVTQTQAEAIIKLIEVYGYSCDSLSSAIQSSYDGSFSVTCNNWKYRYKIEDVGGNWVVTVD